MVDSDRVRALFAMSSCFALAVSPSGDAVAYRLDGADGLTLQVVSVASDRRRELAVDLPPPDAPLYWLPDGDRLACYGHSAGGEAALRQAFRHPDVWTAVVDWAGPFDLVWGIEDGNQPLGWSREVLPDFAEDPDTWHELSPASHAEGLDAALVALYGRRDPVVPVDHGRRLLETVADDAPLEYHEFDAGHGGDLDTDVAVWTTIVDFLDRHCR